jgi:signal transduction histidine kinase
MYKLLYIDKTHLSIYKNLILCFLLYGFSVVFGIYAFIGTFNNFYLIHFGNSIAVIFMNKANNKIERYSYTIVSFFAYFLVRHFQKGYLFVSIAGLFNILEQIIISKLMRKFLEIDSINLSNNLRFINILIGIIFIVSTVIGLILSYVLFKTDSLESNLIWLNIFLTTLFSHISGNYFGLYLYYVLRDGYKSQLFSRKFILDFIVTSGFLIFLNSFKTYYVFQFSIIISILPILAYISVKYNQKQVIITEFIFNIIIFGGIYLKRGPYYLLRKDNGNLLTFIMSLYTIIISSSIMSSLLCVVMTQRRLAFENISQLKNELFFVSSQVSHDIRTPITYINNLCTVIKTGNYTSDDIIDAEEACNTIIDMMDMWLVMLHSSNNNENTTLINVKNKKCEILQLFINIIKHSKRIEKFSSKNLTINLDIDKDTPKYLNIDKKIINYIVNNLMSNAIKYTNDGIIILAVKYFNENLIISVSDTGQGISTDDIKLIFNKFYKVNTDSTDNTYNSHGVGLYIVDTLVKLLNGKINIESKLNIGTTFTITMPCIKVNENFENTIITNIENNNKILSKLKILIVEDSKICQKQLKRMLNKCEIVDIIDNGLLAIDQLLKTDRPYDAVFLDGQLPGLNGLEILEKLSEIKKNNNNSIIKDLGIIIVSGSIINYKVSNIYVVSCVKPYIEHEIIDSLLEVCNKKNVIIV